MNLKIQMLAGKEAKTYFEVYLKISYHQNPIPNDACIFSIYLLFFKELLSNMPSL